jgi:hypothetical protein
MSKKNYTPPNLTSERIFQEASLACPYAGNRPEDPPCQKHTSKCVYNKAVHACTITPRDS